MGKGARIERIGDATLYLGDARDVLASFPPCFRVHAAVMDPPYGIGFPYNSYDDTLPNLAIHSHTGHGDMERFFFRGRMTVADLERLAAEPIPEQPTPDFDVGSGCDETCELEAA